MSVYVDTLINFGDNNAPKCFRNKLSCHMYADTLEELHEMAYTIGLKRSWFQDSKSLQHYNLTPSKRATALYYGAISQDITEAIETRKRLKSASKR